MRAGAAEAQTLMRDAGTITTFPSSHTAIDWPSSLCRRTAARTALRAATITFFMSTPRPGATLRDAGGRLREGRFFIGVPQCFPKAVFHDLNRTPGIAPCDRTRRIGAGIVQQQPAVRNGQVQREEVSKAALVPPPDVGVRDPMAAASDALCDPGDGELRIAQEKKYEVKLIAA